MKEYSTINELNASPDKALGDHLTGVLNHYCIFDELASKDLVYLTGGHIFVAENQDDLKFILKQLHEGDPMFVCKGEYLEYIVCNNNGGGPTYYVPQKVLSDEYYELMAQKGEDKWESL